MTQCADGEAPHGEYALAGPSGKPDRTRLPVRGDLAHIRLAGRCFVPHYAVPIVYRLCLAATLRDAPRDHGASVTEVAAAQLFDVLDIAGEWAWGQLVQTDLTGLVGYLPMTVLERT